MTQAGQPRLYTDLAAWWPLFSPPVHYEEEAADILPVLLGAVETAPTTLLELGSGGGSLAYHLKHALTLTLSDRSPQMLEVSRGVNPDCEHVVGDMRSLDLGRQFDLVLVHDAIMYATTPADVQATLVTAFRHCRPGGAALFIPDCVTETFAADTEHGGEDAADGRALRYVMWTWDQNPADQTFDVAYAFLLRDETGAVHVDSDRHEEGVFPHAAWLSWLRDAGFASTSRRDRWDREMFLGRRR